MSPAIEIFRSAAASSARWNWQTADPAYSAPARHHRAQRVGSDHCHRRGSGRQQRECLGIPAGQDGRGRHRARAIRDRCPKPAFYGVLRVSRLGPRSTAMSAPRHQPVPDQQPANRGPSRRRQRAAPGTANLSDGRGGPVEGHHRALRPRTHAEAVRRHESVPGRGTCGNATGKAGPLAGGGRGAG